MLVDPELPGRADVQASFNAVIIYIYILYDYIVYYIVSHQKSEPTSF